MKFWRGRSSPYSNPIAVVSEGTFLPRRVWRRVFCYLWVFAPKRAWRRKMKTGRYIQVCVNLPELPDNRLYDYHVPADWPFVPALGCRVLVPFAGRRAEAIVWACQEPTYPERIKDVLAVLEELPLLTPEQMSLIDWLA